MNNRDRGSVRCRIGFGRWLALALLVVGLMSSLPLTSPSASAEGSGTVFVHAYGCSEAYNTTVDYDILSGACVASPYYNTFYMITEGNFILGDAANDNIDWTWNDVPEHIFSIKGSVEPYYQAPVVYCVNGGPGNGEYQLMEATTDGTYGYVHPTVAGGYVTCDWFAKGGTGNDTGTVSIDTFECPAGTDPSSEMNDLYVACPTPQNGDTFIVESTRNSASGTTTGDNAVGNVYFPYVLSDFVQITAEQTAGYGTPRVFCRSNMLVTAEIPANNWTFAYNLRADEQLHCDWYNIPTAGAIVQINNHLCPDGDDLRSVDFDTLTATCTMTMNGIQFELSSGGDGRQNFTGDNAGSAIKWFDIVSGESTIHESAPLGYLAPRVFCSNTLSDDANAGNIEEIGVNNNAIQYPIEGGATLVCDWFNLPDGGVAQAGSIAIYPTACPDGFDVDNNSLQQTAKQCTTPQDGTLFDLVTLNETLEHSSGWWESGVTVFYGVGANEGLTLVATPRDGFQTGAVYCGQSLLADGQVGGYDRIDTTDTNTIFPTVVPGAQEVCLWYVVPDGSGNAKINNDNGSDQDANAGDGGDANNDDQDNGGSQELLWTGRVEIEVRVCPQGFDPSSGDLDSSCWDNGNGYEFGIYSADQWWPQTSGDWGDQMVIWDPVPVQDVTVQETLPGGFDTPIVYCDGSQMDVSGDGAIQLAVGDGDVIHCTWFNVQP